MEIRMANQTGIFTSAQGRERYLQAYEDALSLWPVPYEQVDVPTRLGNTHAIAAGSPANPPLVLLHGAGNSATMWYPVIARLSARYRVYALDTIGDGGKSVLSRPVRERSDYSGWLEDVLDGLKIEQAFVAGLSYGGWLALNLALCAPARVRKLALLAPAASLQRFSFQLEFFLRIGTALPIQPSAESTVRWLTDKATRVDPRYVAVLDALNHWAKPAMVYPDVYTDAELAAVRTPTLLVYGDQEIIYDAHKAAARARKLMPAVQVEQIPHASHFISMDQPDRVADCLLSFFEN
jgi:pimeloyl-ACP methyl ester carboxylesterase